MNRRSFLTSLGAVVTAGNTFYVPNFAFADNKNLEHYTLRVDFTTAYLDLFDGQGYVRNYPVVLPKSQVSYQRRLPIFGDVDFIEYDPWWYPTALTRSAYHNSYGVELPKVLSPIGVEGVPPGHPQNAMGLCKCHINFRSDYISPAVRIHGHAREEDLGRRLSRGCIRMRDQDILELASIVDNLPSTTFFTA
jgi:hypothetical protein